MGRINNRPEIKTEEIVRLYESGLGVERVAAELGCSSTMVAKRLRKAGTKMRRFGHSGFSMTANPNWRGGEVDDNGYVRVMIPPDHEFASMRDRSGYVRRSRLVMAAHLGRPLLPTEVVHHKDEDKQHDHISNLELLASNSEHIRKHAAMRRERAFLLAKGQK